MAFPPRVILNPTDYSECSEESLRIAAKLARDYGAQLVVLHVRPPDGGPAGGWCERLRAGLHQLQRTDPDLAVDQCVKEAEDAAGAIVQAASECDSDLIVMGTHGRSGLGRLALGSVAEQFARKAACPVLLVKAPAPA
jgi:nucleotide-binding universal stress UspA family protein